MNITARQLSDNAKGVMLALAKDPAFGSMASVYETVSRLSGLSVSLLQKFIQGKRDNLSVDTLDRLTAALSKLHRDAA